LKQRLPFILGLAILVLTGMLIYRFLGVSKLRQPVTVKGYLMVAKRGIFCRIPR